MTRAAAAALGLSAASACASPGPPPEGPFVAAGFGAARLVTERVAVLPVGEVVLPEGTAAEDSLGEALAAYAGDVLAQGLLGRGAAGRSPGPGVLGPALEAAGPALERAYAGVLRAPPPRDSGGALAGGAEEDYRTLSRVVGATFFLVPLELSYEAVAPLRFRATLDAALVDAGAGRIVWRARVGAENPVAPPGDAADLFAAALEDATSAVADRVARLLASAGE